MNKRKLHAKALTGSKNLRFTEAVRLAEAFWVPTIAGEG